MAVFQSVNDVGQRIGLVVLGMHRSGTSAITRTLGLAGATMPQHLVPANPGNQLGHWESEPLCAFNDRLLARAGLHWISWHPRYLDWRAQPDYADLITEAAGLLIEEFGPSGTFAFKDPRMCRLFPFWRDVFTHLDITPVVVLALRHPFHVGQSLDRRNRILPGFGMLAWLRFMLDAENASRGLVRMVLGYDQLLADWRKALGRIRALASGALAEPEAAMEEVIGAFLSRDLNHFPDQALAIEDRPWIAQAFGVFQGWSKRGESETGRRMLDRIAKDFDAAAPVFLGLIEPTDLLAQALTELDAARAQLVEQAAGAPETRAHSGMG